MPGPVSDEQESNSASPRPEPRAGPAVSFEDQAPRAAYSVSLARVGLADRAAWSLTTASRLVGRDAGRRSSSAGTGNCKSQRRKGFTGMSWLVVGRGLSFL